MRDLTQVMAHAHDQEAEGFGDDAPRKIPGTELHCDNDVEAKRCAKRLADGHTIELWQEARKVATLSPKG